MPIDSFMAGSLTTAMLASPVPQIGTTGLASDQWRVKSIPKAIEAPGLSMSGAQVSSSLPSAEPDWIVRLAAGARRVARLEAGWDGPGSVSVSPKTLFLATSHVRFALDKLQDMSAPHLVPGGDGSVQIEWHAKHGELELDISARGQMSVWIRDHRNGAEFEAENEAALALFYRWAPWVASKQHHGSDAISKTQVPSFSIAA